MGYEEETVLYFGSVKFFKHLIVGVPLLVLLVSVGLNIYFGIENGKRMRKTSRSGKS